MNYNQIGGNQTNQNILKHIFQIKPVKHRENHLVHTQICIPENIQQMNICGGQITQIVQGPINNQILVGNYDIASFISFEGIIKLAGLIGTIFSRLSARTHLVQKLARYNCCTAMHCLIYFSILSSIHRHVYKLMMKSA